MRKLKVVFDYDGPLHDLLKAIEMYMNIPVDKFKVYSFIENEELTIGERDQLLEACRHAELFKVLGMRDVECVRELYATGMVDIFIHTLCWSKEVAEVKNVLLKDALPFLDDEHMLLQIGFDKSTLEDIDILVEDSADNINRSEARVMNLFMPQYHVKQDVSNPLVTTVSSLEDACKWIIDYVKKG